MKFGIGALSFQKPPHDPRGFPELYADLLDLATTAERSGFDSIWLTEHHFSEDGWLPSIIPVAAAMLSRTSRITVGTGIGLAPFYDPLRLAEDAAVLDILSNGRFELGLAIGYRSEEFRAFGIPRKERVARTEEIVAILRKAWAAGPFSFEGRFYQYDDVLVTPKPTRGNVPIPIGAITRPAVERAARIGDGFMPSGTLPIDVLAERVKMAREMAGDRPFEVYVFKYCFVWDDDRAWELFKPGYVYDQQLYAAWYADDVVEGLYRRRLEETETAALQAGVVCGTPDVVVAQIHELQKAIGDFHLLARIWVPGMSREIAEHAVSLFGERVIPAFHQPSGIPRG